MENLGLVKGENILEQHSEYSKIINALQNGSYVILNIPNKYDSNNGHAILLFGVNSNNEVMFVNSSVPGKNAIGDYTACVACCPLQNLTIGGYGNYFIISEGTTKTLLNKTVDEAIGNINSILATIVDGGVS